MKKNILFVLAFLLFFITSPAQLQASEERNVQFFGVGADVKVASPGEYVVNTKGENAEEGFVHTPKKTFTKPNIKFQVELKGTGSAIMKISETDARGQFIKEQTKEVQLTDEWVLNELPFELQSTSSQIDVLVITKDKTATEFSFKNVQVNES